MKIVDAFWEQDNIGLKTVELTFGDGQEPLPDGLLNGYEHAVAKVPATNLAQTHLLEAEGFRFVETQLSLGKRLREVRFDPRVAAFAKSFAYCPVETPEGFAAICEQVGKGLFDTDRIYLDPALGPELSARRYLRWMNTMFLNPARFRFFTLREQASGKDVGFVCMDLSNPEAYRGVLAGIYEDFKNAGLGFLIIYFPLSYAREQGCSYYRTAISTNNLAVLNLYTFFAFQVEGCYTVLRKLNQETAGAG